MEYSFNVGHWHILAVLIATMLMVKSIDFFGVKGRSRQILGWIFFIGSIVAFGGANIYNLRPTPEAIQPGLFITFVGVWFLIVGYMWGLVEISRAFRRERRELKSANLLILGESLVHSRSPCRRP